MTERLAQLRKELLAFIMTVMLGSLLLLAWQYVIKSPFHEYKELAQARDQLEALVANGETITDKIRHYRQEIAALSKKLRGEQPLLSSEEITAQVVGRLDRISTDHKVKLSAVTPGETNKVLMFEEVPFDIEVMGRYADLYSWLYEVTVQLGPMVIPQFKIRYNPGAALLNMNVKLASYKLLDDGS
jgi:Tfp pilus assembly protein PilO